MWIDAMYLLPFIVLGIEKIINLCNEYGDSEKSFWGITLNFFVDKSVPFFPVIIGVTVFCNQFATSVFTCNNSAELLALARPGNKTMAMAFVQTYSSIGGAVGRTATSLVLGTAMLAPVWDFFGREISRYQTFFLVNGVMLLVLFFLLPTLPSFVPEHEDYYEPKK